MPLVNLYIDNREKRPLPFPTTYKLYRHSGPPIGFEIKTHSVRLETGDYMLEGPKSLIVERKAHLTELHNNLLNKRGRALFIAELERMQEWPRRLLLLEGNPLTLKSRLMGNLKTPPEKVRDCLNELLTQFDVELLILPTTSRAQRLAGGEWLLSLMLNARP